LTDARGTPFRWTATRSMPVSGIAVRCVRRQADRDAQNAEKARGTLGI
jgi:hypothetical protein